MKKDLLVHFKSLPSLAKDEHPRVLELHEKLSRSMEALTAAGHEATPAGRGSDYDCYLIENVSDSERGPIIAELRDVLRQFNIMDNVPINYIMLDSGETADRVEDAVNRLKKRRA